MEKEPRKLVFRATPWIFLLVLPLLYVDVLWGNNIQFEQRFHYTSSSPPISSTRKAIIKEPVEEKQESLDSLLSRLVKGEDQEKLKATGFACNSEVYSIHCVSNRPVRVDTRAMTVTIASNQSIRETVIRPYARQEDEVLLERVTPVKILQGNTTLPVCQYNHEIPAVIFSSSGFVGNVFHEINEILIPLFITTRLFKSRVAFILEDYSPSFLRKYGKALSGLTSYEIINPSANQSVHCFPGAVVGLKFHGHLALNSSDIPGGLSMREFRKFLRESMNLKYSHVSQIKTPTVMLLSRRSTRRILNEDELVAMMEELGFRCIRGSSRAGLTNELFLPDGAVMVQVDLIGLEWAAATYYGNPARAMGVHYLRYKIEPEESSLLKVFGRRDHTYITDPRALPVQAGKEVYLNGQNARINITRFRETMVEAMSLVRYSPL
ncbi:UNVERIFIED_CONTAM: Xylan glycosyltransferase MUCI21 [Sesamum calycinum]|uniref:Xylan glycosyltransferase MUCI21 n=1 Tax=Sesamum calycinum TaxID=2727403 RepID=A0AAW2Q4X3_9LAMI